MEYRSSLLRELAESGTLTVSAVVGDRTVTGPVIGIGSRLAVRDLTTGTLVEDVRPEQVAWVSTQPRPDDVTVDEPTDTAPVFYSLPAELARVGMSTADGQDVIGVRIKGDDVLYDVYTARSDDPAQDAETGSGPEGRIAKRGDRVDLAVFPDTDTDGSGHPQATPF